MGIDPSCATDRDYLSNLSLPQTKEAPYEIWAKLTQQLQRRSRLKMLTDGRRHRQSDDRQKVKKKKKKKWISPNKQYFHLIWFKQHQRFCHLKVFMDGRKDRWMDGWQMKSINYCSTWIKWLTFNLKKQEDHDGPISLAWANSFAYLLLNFQQSSLL